MLLVGHETTALKKPVDSVIEPEAAAGPEDCVSSGLVEGGVALVLLSSQILTCPPMQLAAVVLLSFESLTCQPTLELAALLHG